MQSKIYAFLLFFVIGIAACDSNNVKVDNSLKKYFDENKVTGTFGLFDNSHGDFTIYDLSRYKDSVYLPAQTFDPVITMAGIQKGVILNETQPLEPDSSYLPFFAGANVSLKQAFENNNNAYFREVAKRIGRDTLQYWIDTLGYGRRYQKPKIENNVDTFWLDNSVKITPDEQLGLMKKIYFNQLPFQDRPSSILKSLMTEENTANYRLAYITGFGKDPKGDNIGWITGWIEENMHIYPFVLNTQSSDGMENHPAIQLKMLKSILKQLGFFEGKK